MVKRREKSLPLEKFILFTLVFGAINLSTVYSKPEIIGSSVVTSVSVILGNEENVKKGGREESETETTTNVAPTPTSPTEGVTQDTEETTPLIVSNTYSNAVGVDKSGLPLPPPISIATPGLTLLRKSGRKEEGVQNVIQALKTIVKEEQKKHGQKKSESSSSSSTPKSSSSTKSPSSAPPSPATLSTSDESGAVGGGGGGNKRVPGSSMSGEDDDEMESSGGTLGDPGPPTTDAIDDFAKHVVSMQPEETDLEQDNETATSAEVHDAIHKISGAILSVDEEKKKPIENIVTDVLTSINTSRNSSDSHSHSKKGAHPTTAKPSRNKSPKGTTTKAPKTTTKAPKVTTPRPTQKPKPKPNKPSTQATTKAPTTTTATSTTLRPRPPQTSTSKPAHSSSGNQLKTELSEDESSPMSTKDKHKHHTHHQQQQQHSNSHTHNKGKKPAVELPMIIMLDEGVQPSKNSNKKDTAMKNKVEEQVIEMDKPGVMISNEDSAMDKSTDSDIVDKVDNANSEGGVSEQMDKQSETMMEKPVEVEQEGDDNSAIVETTEYDRVPGLPADNAYNQEVNNDNEGQWEQQDNNQPQQQLEEREEEEIQSTEAEEAPSTIVGGGSPQEYTTLRPYVPPPTKAPVQYYGSGKKPGNESTSSKRPNEFYDDEIFGYDPYQTFFHGVYVPVVEVGAASPDANAQDETSSSEEYGHEVYETTSRPRRPGARPSAGANVRPHVKHGKPTGTHHHHHHHHHGSGGSSSNSGHSGNHNGNHNKAKKPVPTLPDHLHRPRPSHLQYQHGAADDTDPETGLLNAHYEHPGHSYGPDGETIAPDKLSLNARPPLPQAVRKNFTDHHDHHTLHQHGFGGHPGHGHGGHGSSHHHTSHEASHHDQHGHSSGHGHHGVSHHDHDHLHQHLHDQAVSEKRPTFAPAPIGNPGLEATLTSLDEEKRLFVDINNRIALRLMSGLTNPVSKASTSYGNMVISPFTITSSLAMLFLGARGQTAAQLDGLLRLDDMLTFNPHMMFHNITESFLSQPNTAAAIIRLLITDKEKGDVLEFYKTRVQHFYEARVEEVDYKFAGHLAQSIINQMIRAQIQRHSYEMLNYSLPLDGPMSLLTSAFFDGQFSGPRDNSIDTMNFIHLAALSGGQKNTGPSGRRLFQIPAFALKGNLRATYDKDLDATAVELPYTTRDLSLIAVMPGKPGEFAIGGVSSLKSRLTLDSWTRLMQGFYPRETFKVVFPRFRHQSGTNISHTLSRFGLTDMFQPDVAKFKGVNGLVDLYLDQNMMHFSEFGTWEKLSDTMRESSEKTHSSNKDLDLIRILRPHVREHYGNAGEPMSVNEWIFKSRNPDQQKRSQSDSFHGIQPDDVSRLRMELDRLKRRPHQPSHLPHGLSGVTSSSSKNDPFMSYTKVSSSNVEFRPRNLKVRGRRSKVYYFRQEAVNTANGGSSQGGEEETVLRFERPFLYFLRHNPTGMILMSGQYTEPSTELFE